MDLLLGIIPWSSMYRASPPPLERRHPRPWPAPCCPGRRHKLAANRGANVGEVFDTSCSTPVQQARPWVFAGGVMQKGWQSGRAGESHHSQAAERKCPKEKGDRSHWRASPSATRGMVSSRPGTWACGSGGIGGQARGDAPWRAKRRNTTDTHDLSGVDTVEVGGQGTTPGRCGAGRQGSGDR
jgi:hypothetical protein